MVKSAKRHEDDEFELVEEEEEDDVVGGGGGGAKNSNSNSNSSSSLVKCPVRVDGKPGQRNTADRTSTPRPSSDGGARLTKGMLPSFFMISFSPLICLLLNIYTQL